MSKSDPSDMSRINLTDDADAIAQKISKARTDPEPLPDTLDGLGARAEARNLVNIYAALAGTSAEAVVAEYAGQPFSVFKPALADLAVGHLAPITGRMKELMADPAEIDRILGEGADRAAAIAEPILARTYEIVGLVAEPGGGGSGVGEELPAECIAEEREQRVLGARETVEALEQGAGRTVAAAEAIGDQLHLRPHDALGM